MPTVEIPPARVQGLTDHERAMQVLGMLLGLPTVALTTDSWLLVATAAEALRAAGLVTVRVVSTYDGPRHVITRCEGARACLEPLQALEGSQ